MGFDWAAAASAAQGGGMILGPILSNINQRNENRWSRDWQEEMYNLENQTNISNWKMQNEYNEGMWNRQNAYNERMWHMMNEYNSPMSQMNRFKEAGLNPNLIYGQQSSAPGISTAQFQKSDMKGASVNSVPPANLQPISFDGIGSMIMGIREAAARTNNLEVQNAILAQKAIGEALSNQNRDIKNSRDEKQLEVITKYSMDAAEAQLSRTKMQTTYMDESRSNLAAQREDIWEKLRWQDQLKPLEIQKMRAEIDRIVEETKIEPLKRDLMKLDIHLRGLGINPNDPMVVRLMVQLMHKYGVDTKLGL